LIERARGCKAAVRLPIERDDVEADLKDKKNRTPLFWAVAGEHEAVVKLLVERDDIEANSKENQCGASTGACIYRALAHPIARPNFLATY
jgi:ankyrin repeat protein